MSDFPFHQFTKKEQELIREAAESEPTLFSSKNNGMITETENFIAVSIKNSHFIWKRIDGMFFAFERSEKFNLEVVEEAEKTIRRFQVAIHFGELLPNPAEISLYSPEQIAEDEGTVVTNSGDMKKVITDFGNYVWSKDDQYIGFEFNGLVIPNFFNDKKSKEKKKKENLRDNPFDEIRKNLNIDSSKTLEDLIKEVLNFDLKEIENKKKFKDSENKNDDEVI